MFKNLNFKVFVYVLVGLSLLLWYGIALVTGLDILKLGDILRLLPKVVTADLLLFFVFSKWGWKFKLFQGWLIPFPDLNGTWQGVIRTTWINPETNERPEPIPVILTIKQTFTNLSCVMRTEEMASYSFAEDFKIDRDRQIKQLVYSYLSNPNLTIAERSPAHNGTIILDIIGNPANELRGQYWTARKTTGEVVLTFREKKLLDRMPKDLGRHPMAEVQ